MNVNGKLPRTTTGSSTESSASNASSVGKATSAAVNGRLRGYSLDELKRHAVVRPEPGYSIKSWLAVAKKLYNHV